MSAIGVQMLGVQKTKKLLMSRILMLGYLTSFFIRKSS